MWKGEHNHIAPPPPGGGSNLVVPNGDTALHRNKGMGSLQRIADVCGDVIRFHTPIFVDQAQDETETVDKIGHMHARRRQPEHHQQKDCENGGGKHKVAQDCQGEAGCFPTGMPVSWAQADWSHTKPLRALMMVTTHLCCSTTVFVDGKEGCHHGGWRLRVHSPLYWDRQGGAALSFQLSHRQIPITCRHPPTPLAKTQKHQIKKIKTVANTNFQNFFPVGGGLVWW